MKIETSFIFRFSNTVMGNAIDHASSEASIVYIIALVNHTFDWVIGVLQQSVIIVIEYTQRRKIKCYQSIPCYIWIPSIFNIKFARLRSESPSYAIRNIVPTNEMQYIFKVDFFLVLFQPRTGRRPRGRPGSAAQLQTTLRSHSLVSQQLEKGTCAFIRSISSPAPFSSCPCLAPMQSILSALNCIFDSIRDAIFEALKSRYMNISSAPIEN